MKKFKRLVAALLVAVMALTMLTACGGGGNNSSSEVNAVLAGLNKRRAEFNVGAVQLNSDLNNFAQQTLQAVFDYEDGKITKEEATEKVARLTLGIYTSTTYSLVGAIGEEKLVTDFSGYTKSEPCVAKSAKYAGIAVGHHNGKTYTIIYVAR